MTRQQYRQRNREGAFRLYRQFVRVGLANELSHQKTLIRAAGHPALLDLSGWRAVVRTALTHAVDSASREVSDHYR